MKKLIALCTLLIAIASTTWAQTSGFKDIIHLKNGSIIKGKILEDIPGETMKIQTAGGNTFVYKYADIEKTAKERVRENVPAVSDSEPATSYNEPAWTDNDTRPNSQTTRRGYHGMIDFGPQYASVDGHNAYGGELSTTHGFQIFNCLFAGLGTGVSYYHVDDMSESNAIFIPLYTAVRYIPINGGFSPFIELRGGYDVYSNMDGNGVYFAANIGLRLGSGKKAFNLMAGYTYRTLDIEYYFKKRYTVSNHGINGAMLKLGWEF